MTNLAPLHILSNSFFVNHANLQTVKR